MPDTTQKLKVRLSAGQRSELDTVCRWLSVVAAKARRARVLLMLDEDYPEGRRRDWEIAEAVGFSERQVVRIRQQFVREGAAALEFKHRPSVPGKLDGMEEVRRLLDEDYPAAETVTLVCDNLNTHDAASLYHAFDADTAARLLGPTTGRSITECQVENLSRGSD